MSCVKGINGRQLREDRGFIVGGRSRVNAGLAILEAECRFEWISAHPVGRRHWLAIIVRIEDDHVLRLRDMNLSVHNRRSVRDG